MHKRPVRSGYGDAPRLCNGSRKLEYAFFAGTSPKFVEAISKMLEKERFEKQDYLFKEGEVGFNMYLISSGSVILCNSSDLQEVEILSRGSHCGELSLLGITKRDRNAIAREHTECLVLRNRHFQAILERFPEEKQHFEQVALQRKKELKQAAKVLKDGRQLRPRAAWRSESPDSDKDAADDPAPRMPKEETSAPLPDTEIPGAYPKESKISILDLAAPPAPPRHGPEQLAPLNARYSRELAAVGRTALARKMQVAEALSKELAPTTSNSLRQRPSSAFSRSPVDKKLVEEVPKISISRPPAVKKALEDDDDDGFDVNFDLNNLSKLDLNAVDPWRRAVSA